MFHVGRFDPSAAERRGAAPSAQTRRARPGERAQGRAIPAPAEAPPPEERAASATAAPAGDSDSSSVPSSSSESESESESDDDASHTPATTLRVIAPAQPPPDAGRARKRTPAEDAALDDFDADADAQAPPRAGAPAPAGGHDAAAARALRLSRLPLALVASAEHWGLPAFLVRNLAADAHAHFFPIQCLVVPDVIESERNAHLRGARDVCCHAPTGSGKTLAFVLPLLASLHRETPPDAEGARGPRRLRALVVLPHRDLARQVHAVFARYARGSHLRIGLAVGGGKRRAELVHERRSLVVDTPHEAFREARDAGGGCVRRRDGGRTAAAAARARHAFDPADLPTALEARDGTPARAAAGPRPPGGGRSAADVLVATPGRLLDHLDATPGFTLQHVRFLVLDEADRLVGPACGDWVGRVLAATAAAPPAAAPLRAPDGTCAVEPVARRGAGHGRAAPGPGEDAGAGGGSAGGGVGRPVPLRKLLFSATLTQDPQKLARLGLENPRHYDANFIQRLARMERNASGYALEARAGRYCVPEGLSESLVECTAEQKPLVLLALLLDEARAGGPATPGREDGDGVRVSLVFTSSVDSTHRLARLLQLLWEAGGFGRAAAVAEFSSALDARQRAAVLRRCRGAAGEERVSVLVCSDGLSRGLDLPSVSAVIHYDVPAHARTYVHRCGRTARAGRAGRAVSVLKGGQAGKFRKMRGLIDGGAVRDAAVDTERIKGVLPTYKLCVKALKRVIEAEENEELLPAERLDAAAWIAKH